MSSSSNLIKVLWDCRKDFSELWHAHQIHLKPVLDMQLVHIHHKVDAQIGSPGWIKLDSLNYAFESIPPTYVKGITYAQMQRMSTGKIPLSHYSLKSSSQGQRTFQLRSCILDSSTFGYRPS